MEQLNRVELRGNVGNIKLQTTKEKKMIIFSLATNKAYNGKDGSAVIETTWHNVVAFEGKEIHDLDKISKGSRVYVCGRLRNQKFTGSDGVERSSYDVLANRLVLINETEDFQCEL